MQSPQSQHSRCKQQLTVAFHGSLQATGVGSRRPPRLLRLNLRQSLARPAALRTFKHCSHIPTPRTSPATLSEWRRNLANAPADPGRRCPLVRSQRPVIGQVSVDAYTRPLQAHFSHITSTHGVKCWAIAGETATASTAALMPHQLLPAENLKMFLKTTLSATVAEPRRLLGVAKQNASSSTAEAGNARMAATTGQSRRRLVPSAPYI